MIRKLRRKHVPTCPAVHVALGQRNFTAELLNQLWLTDNSSHLTSEGKLYLCALEIVFGDRIVGYSTDSRLTAHLGINAVEMTMIHRGIPFPSRKYTQALERHGLVGRWAG